MQLILAAGFLAAVVGHLVLLPLAPLASALLSPVPAMCCFGLLMLLDPRMLAMRKYGAPPASVEQLMAQAMTMPPAPPPHEWTVIALALSVVADFCDGFRAHAAGAPSTAGWEVVHELCAVAALGFLIHAGRRLGSAPSRTLTSALWACAAAVALQLMLMQTAVPSAVGGATWAELTLSAAVACRTCAACAFVGQAAIALLGAASPAYGVGPRDADVARWGAQTAGALLMAVPPVLRALMAPAGGGALSTGASRLGLAALTYSASLAQFPPHARALQGEEEPAGGYQSVAEMRAARRAAREAQARARADAPPPLLLESWSQQGGVQGLDWHDRALCRDRDGDEAHDFWEAVSGGCFRRCTPALCR